jgi:hypothetical protein
MVEFSQRLRPLVSPASAVQRGVGLRRADKAQGCNHSSFLVQFSNSFGSNLLSSIVPVTAPSSKEPKISSVRS